MQRKCQRLLSSIVFFVLLFFFYSVYSKQIEQPDVQRSKIEQTKKKQKKTRRNEERPARTAPVSNQRGRDLRAAPPDIIGDAQVATPADGSMRIRFEMIS